MNDLEKEVVEYEMVEEFLEIIKKKFEEENEEVRKVTVLKKVEQRDRIIEEYIQEFRRVTRGSRYIGRPLVKKFEREMKKEIR